VARRQSRGGPRAHEAARPFSSNAGRKRKALVICAHLRPGRDKRRSNYYMQPIAGLHIGSLIDQQRFDVRLHNEDWHGPFDPTNCVGYDLVFLSGLQPDFDRMRQLSFFFRAAGATVVAGGSICTSFPEFATQFFDAVCVGGVDSVPEVVEDFVCGSLKPIYRSAAATISPYTVDYRLFERSGINPRVHLMESSRGCSFKCSFCVIPAEVGTHATYELDAFAASLESALAASPLWSVQRWYPIVLLLDNNFSDDRDHMLQVAKLLASHPRVKGWAALVTQNVLRDRALVTHLAQSKCFLLFAGVESLDSEMLRRYNKKQNLSRHQNVIDDIAFAEAQGIIICYGYLFDPRHQTAAEMERQIQVIARDPLLPMPVYLSVVAPLAGSATFWDELRQRSLAPNLRLRDLDGETIGYAQFADTPDVIVDFVERIFRRPWTVVLRLQILVKTVRRILHMRTLNPVRWYIVAASNFHCFIWSNATPSQPRTYKAGSDTLDPQYLERPADLSKADRIRYFDPVLLTDADGGPAEWLRSYMPWATESAWRPVVLSHRSSSELQS